jgi:hypothetical protein
VANENRVAAPPGFEYIAVASKNAHVKSFACHELFIENDRARKQKNQTLPIRRQYYLE